MNSKLNPFLFFKHYFHPPTFLGLKKVGWVYQFLFTLAFPTSNKHTEHWGFLLLLFWGGFFFSFSTVHKIRCNSGKAQEKAPRLHLEDMQGLATQSHRAQSQWMLGMLPTCPTEWFRGVFPSQKPAKQQLLGDIREWMLTNAPGSKVLGSQPCRKTAGGIEQVHTQWTPNAPWCFSKDNKTENGQRAVAIKKKKSCLKSSKS